MANKGIWDESLEIPCMLPVYYEEEFVNHVTLDPMKLTEEECLVNGGKWEIRVYAIDSQPRCNLPTSDEGKRCTDSNQCESFCQTEDDVQYGTQSGGTCYGYQFATCANQVINGTALGMICVD